MVHRIPLLLLLPLIGCAPAIQPPSQTNPSQARIITADIERFWQAYDQGQNDNLQEAIERWYFQGASPGLKDWIERRIGSSQNLAQTTRAKASYYASIRENTLSLAQWEGPIRQSMAQLKSLYPAAVFPNIYFLIGRLNSGGTVGPSGLLIGAEMFSLSPQSPTHELNAWEKSVVQNPQALPALVAHELIHAQQRYPRNPTLLAQAIVEGSADFLAEKIAGQHNSRLQHEYGNAQQAALWQEFKSQMLGQDYSGWLYQGAASSHRPADLGYYIGYKIVEAYYQKTANPQQAIYDILNIQDFVAFWQASGYDPSAN